ncbi:MAG: protease complex subunit PrcB family protein [Clostridiales bacterium]|nr:protease complex subunit PrcB family protein [Clostridiales bacterium]
MGKRLSFVCLIALLAVCIVGCGMIRKKGGEAKKVDYTVVKNEDQPAEVKKVIDVKKQEGFQMTYQCEGELYMLKGYGIQSTGGYSIQVEYVTENKEEIHIKTKLVGPASKEEQKDAISCPVIVVKVENRDKKVIFD